MILFSLLKDQMSTDIFTSYIFPKESNIVKNAYNKIINQYTILYTKRRIHNWLKSIFPLVKNVEYMICKNKSNKMNCNCFNCEGQLNSHNYEYMEIYFDLPDDSQTVNLNTVIIKNDKYKFKSYNAEYQFKQNHIIKILYTGMTTIICDNVLYFDDNNDYFDSYGGEYPNIYRPNFIVIPDKHDKVLMRIPCKNAFLAKGINNNLTYRFNMLSIDELTDVPKKLFTYDKLTFANIFKTHRNIKSLLNNEPFILIDRVIILILCSHRFSNCIFSWLPVDIIRIIAKDVYHCKNWLELMFSVTI